jgi:hypothetical protein
MLHLSRLLIYDMLVILLTKEGAAALCHKKQKDFSPAAAKIEFYNLLI